MFLKIANVAHLHKNKTKKSRAFFSNFRKNRVKFSKFPQNGTNFANY